MADLAQAAARTVHFTGYEIPVDKIKVPGPEFRLIGNLLGSADILAQMADRCYLEKCYDRLYPEFVRGGIARKRHQDGSEEIIFASAADLIFKTPRFYQGATKRLQQDLGGCYNYIEEPFQRPESLFRRAGEEHQPRQGDRRRRRHFNAAPPSSQDRRWRRVRASSSSS